MEPEALEILATDSAADLLVRLELEDGFHVVTSTFRDVLDCERPEVDMEFLLAPALAALEVVATAIGRPSHWLGEELDGWITRQQFAVDQPTIDAALRVLDILSEHIAEWQAFWAVPQHRSQVPPEFVPTFAEERMMLRSLRQRLSQPLESAPP